MSRETPPRGEATRALIEDRLAVIETEAGPQETVQVTWRQGTKNLSVISVPVDMLYYNPETRRLRAQRTLDPQADRQAHEQPWSDEAQLYLERLLRGRPSDPSREDPEFTRLRDDLKENGQREPGIITRDGVLVNANTRRVALKDLGVKEMRVAILPSDATPADCEAIELSLQLRREHKRDYSFINYLLALKSEKEARIPDANICKQFGIRDKTLKRDLWILGLIEEAIARSRTVGDDGEVKSLRLIDFEEDKGKLEEFYRAWAAISAGKPDERVALREARLAAVVLDLPKTSVRHIDGTFASRELEKWLPDAPGDRDRESAIPGLDPDLKVDEPSDDAVRVQLLTTDVLQRVARTRGTGQEDEVLISLKEKGFERGIRKVMDDARLKKRELAPAEALSDATENIRLCSELLVNAKMSGGPDLEEMEEQATSLREEVARLGRQLSTMEELPESLAWLRSCVD